MALAPDYAAELKRTYLFAQLPEEHVRRMLDDGEKLLLAAGEGLFRHGEPAERFFLARQGLIKLFRPSHDGDEKIIEIIRPGETFAEAVMFMSKQARYPVNAEAVSETHVLAFRQQTFLALLRESPDACFGPLASMSRRLHMLVNQIDSLTLQNATHRLVAYLLDQIPPGVTTAPEVQPTTPKSVIATRLAIQPEALSRILARLREAGMIYVRGSLIALRDIDALRKLVHWPPEQVT